MLKAGSASSCTADISEPPTTGLAGQSTSQSAKQPVPENVRKRAAPPCFSVSLLKRARLLMAAPAYNAISVLYVLRPGLNFSFATEGGPSHVPAFTCRVSINEEIFEGKGVSKKMAKLNTAEKALKAIMCESECAESVSIPANPISASSSSPQDSKDGSAANPISASSSSSQDSKDGNAAAIVVKSEPVTKELEPTGSSPVVILSGIRQGIQFFEIINSEDEALKRSTGLKLYRMGVVIDGERFEGSGTSKKLAKNYAAEAGLKKLFGLECAHTSNGNPVFTGDSTCWAGFKKSKHEGQEAPLPQVFGLPEGKHPLQMINELYPTVMYTFGENTTVKSSNKYSAYLTIEDTNFEGKGSNRRVARLNAAVEAITFLKNNGLLEQRISDKRKHKAVKPKWRKPQRPSFLKSNGRPFGPPKPTDEKLNDAVQKLKEKFARVDYEVISESTTENSEGEAVMNFTVSATVMDKTFTGDGTSKQHARLEAAEAALRGLGLWTEEDEMMKQEAKRVETDKSRFARMLYGANRMKGSGGGSRDWRSQGKSWVSGGVLAPNPLILPDSKDSGSGGNFEDSQDGSQYSGTGGCGRNMGGQQNQFGMGPPNGYNMGPQNQYGMGPPNGYNMGSQNQYGMGPTNGYNMGPQNQYGMGPVNNYGMGPSNGCGMGPQNNYGNQVAGGFRMGEQSGYGMGQAVGYGGCHNNFGNGGNFSENPRGSYNSWWGQ